MPLICGLRIHVDKRSGNMVHWGIDPDYRFVGVIDAGAVYHRALSQNEINQKMKTGHIVPVESEGKLATAWGDVKAKYRYYDYGNQQLGFAYLSIVTRAGSCFLQALRSSRNDTTRFVYGISRPRERSIWHRICPAARRGLFDV